MICDLCPHHCDLGEGKTGLCRARSNINGVITCNNYGKLTALALDPVEKKPFARFCPGKKILSAGSFGCNLCCPFCQNHEISMAGTDTDTEYYSPERLVRKASELMPFGNIGIAFTYNEPIISYEYVKDCFFLARRHGLKTALVTNGTICEKPLIELLALTDAINIDLKGFTRSFYDMVGGRLDTVMRAIELAAITCHTEVTTLIIPGENDSEEEMNELSKWLKSVKQDIPLHISRFFPTFRMTDKCVTPIETILHLYETAKKHLDYVYIGNC